MRGCNPRAMPGGGVCCECLEPTHYLSLYRSAADGLWRLKRRKIRRVQQMDGNVKLTRGGVLVYWHSQQTPPPGIARGLQPRMKRLCTGGRAIAHFEAEVAVQNEVRRELSHCAMVAR